MSTTKKKAPPALLDRDAILAADDLPVRVVDVPEWGGAVRLRSLTGQQRDAFDTETYKEAMAADKPGAGPRIVRAALVRWCAIGADGELLFAPDDLAALAGKNGAVLDRLWAAAQEHNGFTDRDLEELAGN
jgi:hypothetical protein